jgi:uncharacterized membrane protein YeaQ/YmgE (transglycosylase-associated protein family)
MAVQGGATKKRIIYGLIGAGFAGLIGAHEFAVVEPSSGDTSSMTLPFILAVIGTLCFVAAGLMARKMMKESASK